MAYWPSYFLKIKHLRFLYACLIDGAIYSFTLCGDNASECRALALHEIHVLNVLHSGYLFYSWEQVAICVQFVSHTTERVYLIRLRASV